MSNQLNLSWALRPDPELGSRVIAVWSVEGAESEMLEIDLMGQARRFRDQVQSEWIVIEDDAATLHNPFEPVPLNARLPAFTDAHEAIAG